MNFLKKTVSCPFALIALAWLFSTACRTGKDRGISDEEAYYTCPMHPQIHADQPGDCPICGMKLIQKKAEDASDTLSVDTALSYLTEPVTHTVTGSYNTIVPTQRNTNDTVAVEGLIAFDRRDIYMVAARVTGRIERLYVQYSHQSIQKGQPLMDIYSPQLLQAQRDLLQASREKDRSLADALSAKLINLGMVSEDIQKVVQKGSPLLRVTIYSSRQGIAMPINGLEPKGISAGALGISRGLYVQAGQPLFAIQGIRRRWATLDVLGQDMVPIRRGDPVQLYSEAFPTEKISGRVGFIPPYREGNGKAKSIRVYLDHVPENWKVGTLIRGAIIVSGHAGRIYVPLSAVNRLGTRSVVWVKDKGLPHVFHARLVETGMRLTDSVEIRSGIDAEDQIVENAAYMVDSDSFIL